MLKHSKIIITLLMVLPLAVTVAALFFLPDEMPAHYNAQGEVDRWGSKYEMLIFPFFIPVFGLGMSAVAHVASHGAGANESTAKAIVCANIAALAMFDVMGLYFLINSALVAGGRDGLRVDISNVMCIAMGVAFASILALLLGLNALSIVLEPSFGWYLFCGFCLALSVIAPGMSFSTLLMPLGLYTPFVDGLGHLNMGVLIPGGLGAIVTVICLAKGIDCLFKRHYSIAFHAIMGIVMAATIMTVPFSTFAASAGALITNLACIAVGIAAALALDRFNRRFATEK